MRILLADDHPILRIGLMTLLRQKCKQVTFHEADTHPDVMAIATAHQPHIAIMDLSLGGVFTLDLIKNLKKHVPGMPVLVVSMQDEMHYAERVMKAGAKGYAMKQWSGQTLIQAIDAVSQGKVWLSEQFRNRVIERMMIDSAVSKRGIEGLSDRELMVFKLIGSGLKKSDIAKKLNLSPNTVETYRSHIKHKLGVETGAELSRIAFLQLQEEQSPSPCMTQM
ncbi:MULTISPECIES: response regulator transcription factor [unclassified Herbaspirillum]|uniref:response regulator n=1 Tax=unclassified Herbaspirillum TaxID=2624150 RepID=UPI001072E85C|nr:MULTISPECIES: response regulator transcription factor [unclassified Herbaspirillum]TFI11254.1 response regulator transcription factor [Herbaspirillum sp. 3R11]TFI17162.1 response regulator transcription factor [Herbaspirillum sp. 3R-11]TFI28432.1 response regulator transcription factor [Herbaspirillum sp. 3C11]